MNFPTQTTNTPYINTRFNSTQTLSTQNPKSTQTEPAKEEDCQCEDMKPLLPFQSNFARQLHESSKRRNPEIRMQTRPQQKALSHAPQQQQQQQ